MGGTADGGSLELPGPSLDSESDAVICRRFPQPSQGVGSGGPFCFSLLPCLLHKERQSLDLRLQKL